MHIYIYIYIYDLHNPIVKAKLVPERQLVRSALPPPKKGQSLVFNPT